ncbi:hypothetical protein WHR41_06992 [Cladosporium halotolerans]|uniref:Flavoprotein domain-containing protein n=1 Tax=Cladosporium halotolerans TaxID=1052096 RepID=A0AB34KLB7_9PEZI
MSTREGKAPYEDVLMFLAICVIGGAYCYYSNREIPPFMNSLDQQQASPSVATKSKPLKASDHFSDHKHHLLLAATGSVATIKIPLILHALSHHTNLSVRLILSNSARQFLQAQSAEQPSLEEISKIKNLDGIYFDEDEWAKPWVRGDSILHIELRRWVDLLVVAPLSANGLAKVSQGFSDNLVTSVIRAWDFSGLIDGARPGVKLPYDSGKSAKDLEGLPEEFRAGGRKGIIVAPAMNTAMWKHPVTEKQLAVLEDEWGVANGGWFKVLRPMEKMLACGDTGSGAMRDWKEIVRVIEQRLELGGDADDDVKKG